MSGTAEIEMQLLQALVDTEQSQAHLPGDSFVVVPLGYQGMAVFYPHARPITGYERAHLDHLQELGLLRITRQRSGSDLCQITQEGYRTAERQPGWPASLNEHTLKLSG